MILHTINKPGAIEKCRTLINDSDRVLLLEDGIYLALTETFHCAVIDADVIARGVSERLPAHVQVISYSEFVALAVEADKVCSWF